MYKRACVEVNLLNTFSEYYLYVFFLPITYNIYNICIYLSFSYQFRSKSRVFVILWYGYLYGYKYSIFQVLQADYYGISTYLST